MYRSLTTTKDQRIAVYVQNGFIIRYDTHTFARNSAQGFIAEFSSQVTYLLLLISVTDRYNNYFKISCIHVDESISRAHIENEIKKFERCQKFLFTLGPASEALARKMLGDSLSEWVRVSIPSSTQNFYLDFATALKLLTTFPPQKANVQALALDNLACEHLGIRISASPLQNIFYFRHPFFRALEATQMVSRAYLPSDELKALPHKRCYFDFDQWVEIDFTLPTEVKEIVDKAKTHEHFTQTMNLVNANRGKLSADVSEFVLASNLTLMRVNYDDDLLFVKLIDGLLQILSQRELNGSQGLIDKVLAAIQQPTAAVERISAIEEIKSAESMPYLSPLDLSIFNQQEIYKKCNRTSLFNSIIAYIRTVRLLYYVLSNKDQKKKKTELFSVAILKESAANIAYMSGHMSEAHQYYGEALQLFHLLCTSNHWVMMICTLRLMKNVSLMFLASEREDDYLQAKVSFNSFMRMKLNEAWPEPALILIYRLIQLLLSSIVYESKKQEIEILQSMYDQFASNSQERMRAQHGDVANDSANYLKLLSPHKVNVQRELDEALKVLVNLFYHFFTSSGHQTDALNPIAMLLKKLGSTHCSRLWRELIYVVNLSYMEHLSHKSEITGDDLLPFFCMIYHLDSMALMLAVENPLLSLVHLRARKSLIVSILRRIEFVVKDPEEAHANGIDVLSFSKRNLLIFCKVMSRLHENPVTCELYQCLPQIISFVSNNQQPEELQLLKWIVGSFLKMLEENVDTNAKNEQQMVRSTWAHLFNVLFAEKYLQYMSPDCVNGFMEIMKGLNTATKNAIVKSASHYFTMFYLKMADNVTETLSANAAYLHQQCMSSNDSDDSFDLAMYLLSLAISVARLKSDVDALGKLRQQMENMVDRDDEDLLNKAVQKFRRIKQIQEFAARGTIVDALPCGEGDAEVQSNCEFVSQHTRALTTTSYAQLNENGYLFFSTDQRRRWQEDKVTHSFSEELMVEPEISNLSY